MIPICDDQEDARARACPGYAPGRTAGQGYPSDLSDAQWQVIAAQLPADWPGRRGRPRIWPARRIIEAILYLDRTGCAWRYLPADFPPWQTVYGYFAAWRDDGTLARLRAVGRDLGPALGKGWLRGTGAPTRVVVTCEDGHLLADLPGLQGAHLRPEPAGAGPGGARGRGAGR